MYRELLNDYLKIGRGGQTPLVTDAAFEFHRAFANHGDMQKADFSKFA